MPRGVVADPPQSPGYIVVCGRLSKSEYLNGLLQEGTVIEVTSPRGFPEGTIVDIDDKDGIIRAYGAEFVRS